MLSSKTNGLRYKAAPRKGFTTGPGTVRLPAPPLVFHFKLQTVTREFPSVWPLLRVGAFHHLLNVPADPSHSGDDSNAAIAPPVGRS